MNSTDNYQFDIFGGEPFLTLDEIEYIIDIISHDDKCKVIGITTNGTVFNERVAKILANSKVICQLSHDGVNQEKNRGKNNIYIKELIKYGVKIGHSMLIGNDFNNRDINPIITNHLYLENLGLSPDLTIVRDIGCWNILQVENFKLHYMQYIDCLIIDINNDKYKTFRELPLLLKKYLAGLLEAVVNKNLKTDCGCGTRYLTVTPDKQISPCERFLRDDTTIHKLENKLDVLSACNTCSIRDYCDRGCIYEQLKNNGPIVELCDIYKIIFIEIQRLIKFTGIKTIELFKK
jgi:radical SAM protein with 4Fe4S-binding SPASM domain